jgi:hypothetical protein
MYCLKHNPDFYQEDGYGLFISYGHDQDLFKLLSLTHMAFFPYEEDTIKVPKLHTLDNIQTYRDSLTAEVRRALQRLPTLFNEPLPLLAEPSLELVMYLRRLQWRKHYRGKLQGNVVQFRSSLNKEEETFLQEAILAL